MCNICNIYFNDVYCVARIKLTVANLVHGELPVSNVWLVLCWKYWSWLLVAVVLEQA